MWRPLSVNNISRLITPLRIKSYSLMKVSTLDFARIAFNETFCTPERTRTANTHLERVVTYSNLSTGAYCACTWTRTTEPKGDDLQSSAIATMRYRRVM
jgi:hypothetical protein